jgi:hypothetical protein
MVTSNNILNKGKHIIFCQKQTDPTQPDLYKIVFRQMYTLYYLLFNTVYKDSWCNK